MSECDCGTCDCGTCDCGCCDFGFCDALDCECAACDCNCNSVNAGADCIQICCFCCIDVCNTNAINRSKPAYELTGNTDANGVYTNTPIVNQPRPVAAPTMVSTTDQQTDLAVLGLTLSEDGKPVARDVENTHLLAPPPSYSEATGQLQS